MKGKKRSEHLYMVGWKQDVTRMNVVYGKDREKGIGGWTEAMTLAQARRQVRALDGSAPRQIFKLVPVEWFCFRCQEIMEEFGL